MKWTDAIESDHGYGISSHSSPNQNGPILSKCVIQATILAEQRSR